MLWLGSQGLALLLSHLRLGLNHIAASGVVAFGMMFRAIAEVIALATADKLRTASPWIVARLADVDHLVTDGADELDAPVRGRGHQRGRGVTPRLATFLTFVVNGAMIGTWVAHIPWLETTSASRRRRSASVCCAWRRAHSSRCR